MANSTSNAADSSDLSSTKHYSATSALRVALIYGALSALWIISSDLLMVHLGRDGESLKPVSIAKGLAFVAVTAGLLFLLVRHYVGMIQRRAEALRLREIDAQRLAESRKRLLRELDHRVKNNLANLYSLVELHSRSAGSVQDFATVLGGKILAMSRMHEITNSDGWQGISMRDLVLAMADPAVPSLPSGDRIEVEGPPLIIAQRQAAAMGMILHELFTNARKHGSLGAPEGRVHILWCVTDEKAEALAVQMIWRESGGPKISAPKKFGVGLELIEGLSRFELAGRAKLAFEPDGLRLTIDANFDHSEHTPMPRN